MLGSNCSIGEPLLQMHIPQRARSKKDLTVLLGLLIGLSFAAFLSLPSATERRPKLPESSIDMSVWGDAANYVSKAGDDASNYVNKVGNAVNDGDAANFVGKYWNDAANYVNKSGDDAANYVNKVGKAVNDSDAANFIGKSWNDAANYVNKSGHDAANYVNKARGDAANYVLDAAQEILHQVCEELFGMSFNHVMSLWRRLSFFLWIILSVFLAGCLGIGPRYALYIDAGLCICGVDKFAYCVYLIGSMLGEYPKASLICFIVVTLLDSFDCLPKLFPTLPACLSRITNRAGMASRTPNDELLRDVQLLVTQMVDKLVALSLYNYPAPKASIIDSNNQIQHAP